MTTIHTEQTSTSRLLRDLNTRTHTMLGALNQAQASVSHALKLVQIHYQEERRHILNGHDMKVNEDS